MTTVHTPQNYCTETDAFENVLMRMETRLSGLTPEEVKAKHEKYGLNIIHKRSINAFSIFLRQITGNALIIVLSVATLVSFLLGDHTSSYYIMWMIALSIGLGFWNEYSAEKTVEKLLQQISPTTTVLRADTREEIPVSEVTIGDIVLLSQGSIVPADMRLIYTNDVQLNQSVLTGESKTSYKTCDTLAEAPKSISACANIAFMGTAVDTGSARGVVIRIGKDTEFGKIAESTIFTKPQTDFEKGLSSFGGLLTKTILALTVGIFAINFILGRSMLDALLFALAIAVGLTPELLPVIVTISLAHGAGKLAKKKVIAKQLIAIENLGNMDVLCTDKTGTLTQGSIEVVDYMNTKSEKDPTVLKAALLANNAIAHHHIIGSGIDAALWKYAMKNKIDPDPTLVKVDDEAFDFNRKAMFSVVKDTQSNDSHTLILKGAPEFVLSHCPAVNAEEWHAKFASLNSDGLRVVAVARANVPEKKEYTWADVESCELLGYISFLDVPKLSAKEALAHLQHLNVAIKIVTGDNELVTQKVCKEVGMEITGIVLGADIEKMTDEELAKAAQTANIFARVSPDQKMRIIATFKSLGHAVGFMGDGINDIPSLRTADVGISVNTAIDVAKESASIVLLSKGLDVIADGIMEGRKTFSNTIKYILMGTSSNFGNMFSAAGASFLLPFLPMLPAQILLTNALYDISQLSITTDNVDKDSLIKPRHWDISFIRKYMVFFGPISSLYDFMTFGVMLFVFHASGDLFQTGWFVESVMTEILVVFVIRTSIVPFYKSRPSNWLLGTCLSIVAVALVIPYTSIGTSLGFVPLPPLYFLFLIAMVATYLMLVEFLKQKFLKRYGV